MCSSTRNLRGADFCKWQRCSQQQLYSSALTSLCIFVGAQREFFVFIFNFVGSFYLLLFAVGWVPSISATSGQLVVVALAVVQRRLIGPAAHLRSHACHQTHRSILLTGLRCDSSAAAYFYNDSQYSMLAKVACVSDFYFIFTLAFHFVLFMFIQLIWFLFWFWRICSATNLFILFFLFFLCYKFFKNAFSMYNNSFGCCNAHNYL